MAGSYASNYVPLYCGVATGDSGRLAAILRSLPSSGLLLPGGLATSAALHFHAAQPQQWEYPNAWAPLVSMLAAGLEGAATQLELASGSGVRESESDAAAAGSARQAREIAAQLRTAFLRAALDGFQSTGFLYEKYDVRIETESESGRDGTERANSESAHAHATTQAHAHAKGSRQGGGGEYAPQVGFGWTNGVVLEFICAALEARGGPGPAVYAA